MKVATLPKHVSLNCAPSHGTNCVRRSFVKGLVLKRRHVGHVVCSNGTHKDCNVAHQWKLAAVPAAFVIASSMMLTLAPQAIANDTGGRIGGTSGFERARAETARKTETAPSRESSSYSSYTAPSRSYESYPYETSYSRPTVVYTEPASTYRTYVAVPSTPPAYSYSSSSHSELDGTTFLVIGGVVLFLLLLRWIVGVFDGVKSKFTNVVDGKTSEPAIPPAASVSKLQVALSASQARTLKRDLARLAMRADTSSPEGLHAVLQEVGLNLLRHPEDCLYATSTVKGLPELDSAEKAFNDSSLEERVKYRRETVSNFEGMADRRDYYPTKSGVNELIVVTLLLATYGRLPLPTIRKPEDVTSALRTLVGLSSDDILAFEVLWTPQAEGDTMTADDLLAKYPKMLPL